MPSQISSVESSNGEEGWGGRGIVRHWIETERVKDYVCETASSQMEDIVKVPRLWWKVWFFCIIFCASGPGITVPILPFPFSNSHNAGWSHIVFMDVWHMVLAQSGTGMENAGLWERKMDLLAFNFMWSILGMYNDPSEFFRKSSDLFGLTSGCFHWSASAVLARFSEVLDTIFETIQQSTFKEILDAKLYFWIDTTGLLTQIHQDHRSIMHENFLGLVF